MTVKYRGKYILEGLKEITPEMEKDLDAAYEICESYRGMFPCETCGKCCHQAYIIVQPHEVDRIATYSDIPLNEFMMQYIKYTPDGRMLFKKTNPCAFLGKDNRCAIWKCRPEICDDFPYLVSLFMSRVYLAITNEDADILELIDYMEKDWPCSKIIRSNIAEKVNEARAKRSSGL